MSVQIKIEESNFKHWNKDLNSFYYSLFITPEWIEAAADKNHTPVYLDFFQNDIKIGKISGLVIKRNKSKSYLYFYAGPALKELNEKIFNKCLDSLYRYAKKNSYSMVSLSSFDNRHSMKYKGYKYTVTKRVEFVVPLKAGINSIKISNRFRRNIKKGEKFEPVIKRSTNISTLNNLYNLLDETKKTRISKYKTDYQPFYLTNLNKNTIQKLVTSGFAKMHYTIKNNSIDCIELNLEKDKYVYMLLKGSNEKGYRSGMSAYLSYSLINEYIKNGYYTYNQGGRPLTSDGDGLEIFKKSMGAEKIIVYSAVSNFLTYPHRLLNPFMLILQLLPKSLVYYIKKRFW